MASPTPAQILKRNRDRVAELARTAGAGRTQQMLERAARELSRRLRSVRGLNGTGDTTFTSAQMALTLKQIEEVLRPLKAGMGTVIVDEGTVAAEASASGALRYIDAAEQSFKGINQGLALREASMLDNAVMDTQSSMLRRISTDPAHPDRPGVIDRYGANVITAFEETLQQRFLQRKPWAMVRDELVESSPFLKDKPLFWAERIVRTEVIAAHNRASAAVLDQAQEELGDMLKILSCVFDARTGADSIAVHGQIRRPDELFESWHGSFPQPPDRPNDRAIAVPHRMSWPIPGALKPRSDAEVLARWMKEGRKGAPPARPLMSTVDVALIGVAPEPAQQAAPAASAPVPEQVASPEPPIERVPVQGSARRIADTGVRVFHYGEDGDRIRDTEKPFEAVVQKVFGAEMPSLDALMRTWGSEKTQVHAQRVETSSYLDDEGRLVHSFAVAGELHHQGQPVGRFERTFIRHTNTGELEVHHDLFKFDVKDKQNDGSATAMMRQSVKAYEQLGASKITVDTEWVGRYTWASFGCDWSPAEAAARVKPLSAFLEKHGIDAARALDIASRATRHAWDVAALDVDGITVEVRVEGLVRKEKLGKAFLLSHPGWSGEMLLDPSHPTYQRAKERLGL